MLKSRSSLLWAIGVLLVVYSGLEAASLLCGYGVIPFFWDRGATAFSSGMLVGGLVERAMWQLYDRKMLLSPAFAMLYICPLMAGIAVSAAGWLVWLSITVFGVIMVRDIWIISTAGT